MPKHSTKQSGKIKWFNDIKGIGFIQAAESGQDIFVHRSSIDDESYVSLFEGESVSFDIAEGARGPQAVNVTKLN